MYDSIDDDDFVLIAAAQDTGGVPVAAPWYEQAQASYVTLVDRNHSISSLFGLANVPSAVWIDENGYVRRIDEGAYAEVHKMGDFQFGRADYAPMVLDWAANGEASEHLLAPEDLPLAAQTDTQALAEPAFKLGVYFHLQGDEVKANHYWQQAQELNPDSWNYHRQDWSFTPEEAGPNWQRKFQTLEGKPYYRPIDGLDGH